MTKGAREEIKRRLTIIEEVGTNPDYKGWIYFELIGWIYCSHCGEEAPENKPTKYCPNCRADMSIIGKYAEGKQVAHVCG